MTLKRALMWLSFLAPLAVYFYTAAPGIYWEDSAAFQAAAYELGIVHNPSFPVYVLLAHLFTLIPFGNPQWLVNLLSGILVSLSSLFLFKTISLTNSATADDQSPRNDLIALACALGFSLTYGVWIQAVRAEVYALSLFLTLLIIWLVIRYKSDSAESWHYTFGIGTCFGLGLANHYLILGAVAIPILVFAFVRYRHEFIRPRPVLMFALGILIGLAFYVYLPIRESYLPVFNWGDFSSLDATLRSILRFDEILPISQMTVTTPFLQRLGSTISELWRSLPFLLWALAIIGFATTLFKNRFLGLLAIAALVFSTAVTAYAADFSRYNLDLYGYLMPAYSAIFVAVALGTNSILTWVLNIVESGGKLIRVGVPAIVIVTIFAKAGYLLVVNYADASKREICTPEEYAVSILDQLDAEAIFLAGEDNSFSPLLCKQIVDSYRQDVTVVSAGALLRSDYRRKIQLRHADLWYPSNWNDREFAVVFQDNLFEWIDRNSEDRQVAMTLSQWTAPLVGNLYPLGYSYVYSDKTSLSQKRAAASVDFYRENEGLWKGSCDITTREHFGRLLYNLGYYYSKHHQPQLAAKYNRDAVASDPTNVDLLLNCLKMAIYTRQVEDQSRIAAIIEEIDPGNPKLDQILRAALAAVQEYESGR